MASQMHVSEFEVRIEQIITENIAKVYSYNRDENHITHGIVGDFHRNFRQVELMGNRMDVQIDWEVYKFRGSRENQFGDIGISVTSKLRDGSIIHGAGFMEAKLRGRANNRFAEIGALQWRRILKSAPQTQMLLYDYADVPINDPARDYDHWHWLYHERGLQPTITHAPIVPMQLVTVSGNGIRRFMSLLPRHHFS